MKKIFFTIILMCVSVVAESAEFKNKDYKYAIIFGDDFKNNNIEVTYYYDVYWKKKDNMDVGKTAKKYIYKRLSKIYTGLDEVDSIDHTKNFDLIFIPHMDGVYVDQNIDRYPGTGGVAGEGGVAEIRISVDILTYNKYVLASVKSYSRVSKFKNDGVFASELASPLECIKPALIEAMEKLILEIGKIDKLSEYKILTLIRKNSPDKLLEKADFDGLNYIVTKTNSYNADIVNWYEIAANNGIGKAQYELGKIYENGNGTKRDYGRSFELYQKAASSGNKDAQLALGDMYFEGKGVTKNHNEAAIWYTKSADQGNISLHLGDIYMYGSSIKQDDIEAAKWYRKMALQGNIEAKSKVEQLERSSHRLNQAEAENGDAIAQERLADMYLEGRGVPKNDVEAVNWYRKSALQGNQNALSKVGKLEKMSLALNQAEAENEDAIAQERLADMYLEGRGVPKNEIEAVRWYRKSALQGNQNALSKVFELEKVSLVLNQKEADGGDAAALKRLGDMYAEGISVPKNMSEAMKLYRKSAELDYVKAYTAIGSMYAKGLGVQKNDIEAYKWYKKAQEKGDDGAEIEIRNLDDISPAVNKMNAEKGDVNAMIHLADLYSEGKSTTKNVNEAKKWYKFAARKKEKDADYDIAIDLYKKAGDKDGVRRIDSLIAKKEQKERRAAKQRAQADRMYLCNTARNYARSLREPLSSQISAGQSFAQAVRSYYGPSGYYSIAERYGRNTVDYVLRSECR